MFSPGGLKLVLFVCLAVSLAMILFGRWGQKNAANLLPEKVVTERRDKKLRQLRRGGITWQIVGVLFAVFAIVGLVTAWSG
jgi:hypothetical protein